MFKLVIDPNFVKGHINPELQGHFSEHLGRCIYEGLYVGENSDIPNTNGMRNDVVEALKAMKIPVLRWPGGCFADEYHWKDGIGEKSTRKRMINTHWGGVVEDNSFGTHEFMELCRQIGAKTYINGNVGSGTVQEMSEWVEYMTFDGVSPMAELRKKNGSEAPWTVNYFGVGNENWGCGGNMLPEYYANEYRRYQTYVRNYDRSKPIYKIACGANAGDYEWTEKVLETCFRNSNDRMPGFMNGLSLHYYTVPRVWSDKGPATGFPVEEWYSTLDHTLFMEELVTRHSEIMDKYDKDKRIGLIVDEWGTWYTVEPGTNPGFLYQQNTIRDALVAGINLNIFNKHCDRVQMANIAQLVNVLQAVILTDGEKMILTPTYHVFKMYSCHQGNELVDSHIQTEMIGTEENKVPNLHESASIDADGTVHITLNNLSATEAYEIDGQLIDTPITGVSGEIVTGEMGAYNTFDDPEVVKTAAFDKVKIDGNRASFTIPPCSVLHLAVKTK